MKFTLNDLKEFLITDHNAAEIADKLTCLGHEIEELTNKADNYYGFVVAEIIEAIPHPEADKLRLCKVNNGNNILDVVCGAPNARSGIKVILAQIGAVVPANKMVIKESKIRGAKSEGMLCSNEELGFNGDSSGIIELPSDAQVGDTIIDYFKLDDPLFKVSITPNRGDVLSVYGIARDLAAGKFGKLKEIVYPEITANIKNKFNVENHSPNCKYVTFRYFENVKNCESPAWLKNSLERVGLKSISALVDITNYVCHRYGRPSHIYDADKINGDINIRNAFANEKFNALNEKEYCLRDSDLVIADSEKVLALAGIIGGENSKCEMNTTNILLEAAVFDPKVTALSGRAHYINTDSRYRFDRGIDHNFTRKSVDIISKMILDICGGNVSEVIYAGNEIVDSYKLHFDFAKQKSLTGINISEIEATNILEDLGFKVHPRFELEVPSWRHDISISEDIVEEITRIYGYDKLTTEPLPRSTNLPLLCLNLAQRRSMEVKRMIASQGFYEVVTWSFMERNKASYFSETSDDLEVENPINVDLNYMRPSIIPNLLNAFCKNAARGITNLSLFEVGPIFIDQSTEFEAIAALRIGEVTNKTVHNEKRNVDFYDIKANVNDIISEYGFDPDKLILTKCDKSYFHPGKSSTIKIGKIEIGSYGELHPKIAKLYDIKEKIYALEIIPSFIPLKLKQQPIYAPSIYQAISRDFSFIVDKTIEAQDIIRTIKATNKDLIVSIDIFDIYQSDKLGVDKKSVAVNVVLQSPDHTFTEVEIELISSKIINEVNNKFGGVIRS